MAELRASENELTTVDLASYGILPEQPKGPQLVKGPEPQHLDRAAALSEPTPLISGPELGNLRSQESGPHTDFVDEACETVEHDDKQVVSVMHQLAEGRADEQPGLEKPGEQGDDTSTDD